MEDVRPTMTPDTFPQGPAPVSDGAAPVPQTASYNGTDDTKEVAASMVPQAPDDDSNDDDELKGVVGSALTPNPNPSPRLTPFASPFADAPVPDTEAFGQMGSDLLIDGQSHSLSLLDGSRQHHLLRHSLPTEQRGHGVLSHFGVETISDAAKIIKKMSQRELQAKFKLVYGARTFSNNNNWLRRKLFEAIGLDPSKGAVKKPGAGTQRRRRPAKTASPRSGGGHGGGYRRRAVSPVDDIDGQPVAEALIALGELATLAYHGYDLDELEEAAAAIDGSGSGGDGRVPSTTLDEPRLSWSAQAAAEARGVPRAGTVSPGAQVESIPTPDHHATMTENDVGAGAVMADHQDMGSAIFEWMIKMQQQAMQTAAAPHQQAAALAAFMSQAPPHVQQAQHQMHALQMAAMAGHPHAQQMLHAMMAEAAAAAAAAHQHQHHHQHQQLPVYAGVGHHQE